MSSPGIEEIKMDEVRYRPVREDEIRASVEIFLTSLSDLATRLSDEWSNICLRGRRSFED
jgi:hypothetical protein